MAFEKPKLPLLNDLEPIFSGIQNYFQFNFVPQWVWIKYFVPGIPLFLFFIRQTLFNFVIRSSAG